MGRIANLLSFIRTTRNGANVSDVKVDPGGGYNVTVEHYSAPGDDSHPLTTDYVHINSNERSGGENAIGYLDPLNAGVAQPGDKRIYARDADTGLTVVSWWLKNDGSAILANALGSIELLADGSVNINGVIIDSSGNMIIPASLVLNGKEIAEHDHSQGNDSDGSVEQDTGPNN